MLGISENSFEENQFSLDDSYSVLLKVCSVARMNCGDVSSNPFILNQLKMEEDIIFIRVGLISAIPVEDTVFVCEEIALNGVLLITFTICDSIEDGVSFCLLILKLEHHSPW